MADDTDHAALHETGEDHTVMALRMALAGVDDECDHLRRELDTLRGERDDAHTTGRREGLRQAAALVRSRADELAAAWRNLVDADDIRDVADDIEALTTPQRAGTGAE